MVNNIMNSYQKIYTLLIESDSLEEATAKQKLLATALGLGGLAGAVASVGKDRPHPPVTGPSIRTTSQRTPAAQLPKLQAKRDAPVASNRVIAPPVVDKDWEYEKERKKEAARKLAAAGTNDSEYIARKRERRDDLVSQWRGRIDAMGPDAFRFSSVGGRRFHMDRSLAGGPGGRQAYSAKEMKKMTDEGGWKTTHPEGTPWKDWGY